MNTHNLGKLFSSTCALALGVGILSFAALETRAGTAGPTQEQLSLCDVTNDGIVDFRDISKIASTMGVNAGTLPYREGLDVSPNGTGDINDYLVLLQARCLFKPAETDGTTFNGTVSDGLGNPLPGVAVRVGSNTVEGCTNEFGKYSLDIGSGDVGENLVTFDGAAGNSCGGPNDPTPGLLSGQYPTIPNKPIYINAGIPNNFREMSLPERDLTNALNLVNVATPSGPGEWLLNQNATYKNAGVSMMIPEGCTVQFPGSELNNTLLSITRVDPARLPVAMPPGLSSSIFVTYQPGEAEIICPPGKNPMTTFDNVDKFVNSDDLNGDDQPFLAGVIGGVFQKIATITVVEPDGAGGFTPTPVDDVGPTLKATIPTPFPFAWYHVDVPLAPCARTTVTGFVLQNDGPPMTPVAGASVSVPGVVPVLSGADGGFSIPNVPAGPNGPNCFSNPFSLRAAANDGADVGVSASVLGVPGGSTDVGNIKFGLSGTVQGQAVKLSSVDPFVVTPLPGADVDLSPFGNLPKILDTTDANGNFHLPDVPVAPYILNVAFAGNLTTPGGGSVFKELSDDLGAEINFDGEIQNQSFRFVGTGSVQVTVLDHLGDPAQFVFVDLQGRGGPLGGGFTAPQSFCGTETDDEGVALINDCFVTGSNTGDGVPQGLCDINVFSGEDDEGGEFFDGFFGAEETGCNVNVHGEQVNVEIQLPPPPPPFGDVSGLNLESASAVFEELNNTTLSTITVSVDFFNPVLSRFEQSVFLDLSMDIDQDPNTGNNPGFIDNELSFAGLPPTGLGVDMNISCDFVPSGNGSCELFDANNNLVANVPVSRPAFQGSPIPPNGPDTRIQFHIPRDLFLTALATAGFDTNGPFSFNYAMLIDNGGNGGGGVFTNAVIGNGGDFDVVPNGGSLTYQVDGPDVSTPDDPDDLFGNFFYCDFCTD